MAVVAAGKPARTRQCVQARAGFAALRCTLHSGRTHQIRVHLAPRGLPLVVDRLYGGNRRSAWSGRPCTRPGSPRASRVGQTMSFDCAPPSDFAHAWTQIAGPDDLEPPQAVPTENPMAAIPFDASSPCRRSAGRAFDETIET